MLVSLGLVPQAGSAAPSCGPSSARTLLSTSSVRVYRQAAPRTARGLRISACLVASRKTLDLDDGDAVFAFTPPAIAVHRTLVGSAFNFCDAADPLHGCQTKVVVDDLSKAEPASGHVFIASAGPSDRPVVKVGSLRVAGDGTLAWIACPEPAANAESELRADRGPTCVRRGNTDRVYVQGPSTPKRRLGIGRDIDPSSLRLSGNRVAWRAGGRTRHAHLKHTK